MKPSGTASGERQLAGPQTSGREYRNLSKPEFSVINENNVAIPMRDNISLHADVFRPDHEGRFPALVAISSYPRQIQHLGLPVGFVEAGQTDFFVPRGYAHVIANCRGTGGSGGTYEFFGAAERTDLYDLIEWVAAQPWCNGQVGMIGVSYFAMEQLRAAIEAPPHLRAIFPFSSTADIYRELAWHGGMFCGRFMARYFNAIGMADRKPENFFRAPFFRALNKLLLRPSIHKRLAAPHGDTLKAFGRIQVFPYNPHPWDDIYYNVAVEHQLFDDYWKERDVTDQLKDIRIPMYLGADWENVSVHLDTAFIALDHISKDIPYRVTLAPRGTLQWPWESLHIEALAWYDHWLKGKDTGIMEGPPVRYFVEGANEWRTTDTFPLPETKFTELYLRTDGTLSKTQDKGNARIYMHLPASLDQQRNVNPPPYPPQLSWETEPFTEAVELIGPFVLRLAAASTATDADWIVKLQNVAPDGKTRDLTEGWLRASHRALDPARSKPYRPYHPHDKVEPLRPGEKTWFEIAILPTAEQFAPGHRLRIILTSQDQDFAMQGLSHMTVGLAAKNSIFGDSQLIVPLIKGKMG